MLLVLSKRFLLSVLCYIVVVHARVIKAHLLEEQGPLECLLVHVEQYCPDQTCDDTLENDWWKCNDDHGVGYMLVDLPADFFSNNILRSGQSVLSVSSATKRRGELRNEIIVNPGAALSVQIQETWPTRGRAVRGRNRRNLQRLGGTRTVLVVYIISLDSSPTYDFDTVVNDVLGTAGDMANMVSQYAACSGNQLNFVPAENPSDGVTGGAVIVNLDRNTNDVWRGVIETWVDNYIDDNGHNWLIDFDHLMYVLPVGTDFGSASAYADSTNVKTIYNNAAITQISTQVHEVGHNLGMSHSGEDQSQYGDKTCYMGSVFVGDPERNRDEPLMCFNAAKSWYTGWYTAGHEEIDTLGWEGQLVGVDDFTGGRFDYDAGDRVLLKIPYPGTNNMREDLYVMYNRAKGINQGVIEARNEVVIVKGPQLELEYNVSWRVADLDASERNTFISAEHGYEGSRLVIEVSEIVQNPTGTKDYASVSVYFDSTPTSSPTSCGNGEFKIDLKTDNFPQETSWEVRSLATLQVVASGSEYGGGLKTYSESYCFEDDGPFEFSIFDEYGDGICCLNGEGSYSVYYNGEHVHTGGAFGRLDSFILGLDGDSQLNDLRSPTSQPSATPTTAPTRAPSATPTTTPSTTPTPAPTRTPSATPTAKPSSTPSSAPVEKVYVRDICNRPNPPPRCYRGRPPRMYLNSDP